MSENRNDNNVNAIKNQRLAYRIIMTGFGIVGALASLAIWMPDNALKVEFAVAAAISGILGFLAGRKT